MWFGDSPRRQAWKKIGLYLAALFVLPLVAGMLVALVAARNWMTVQYHEQPFEQLPSRPEHDASKPTAAVLVSNLGTEVTDILAPYAILAGSGALNVYTTAPSREASPIWHGVDIIPHYSFRELEQMLGDPPDVVLVPNIADPEDPMITEWVRRNTAPDSLLVAVCEGVRVLAAAGLLQDRSASSHFFALGQLDRDYPDTQWIRGVRWVEDGNLITSAGVTASIDATFHALRRVAGLEVAQRTARDVGYEMELHPREVDPFNFETSDFLSLFMTAGFLWNKTDVGVALYEGIDEIELAAILDLYPRVLDGSAWTVAPVREPIRSRNGLDLVAWSSFDESPDFDAVLIPEFLKAPPAEAERAVVEWSKNHSVQVRRFNETIAGAASRGFPYDAALLDIAQRRSKAVARGVAKTVEYPLTHLALGGAAWPYHLFAIPVGLGLVGLALARWRVTTGRRNLL